MVHLVVAQKTGNPFDLRVIGIAVGKIADAGAVDASGYSAVGRPVFLGGRTELFQVLDGDIAEVIAVNGTLTSEEVAGLDAFLRRRYKL